MTFTTTPSTSCRHEFEMHFGQLKTEERPDRTADRDPDRHRMERRLISLRYGLSVLEGLAARDRDAGRCTSIDLMGRMTRHRAEILAATAELTALTRKDI